MEMILTEKPSVAQKIAVGIGGPITRKDGYLRVGNYAITWAFGHLVETLMPDDYDPKWKSRDISLLPIVPAEFRYRAAPDPGAKRQLNIIKTLVNDPSVTRIIFAGDPGREGELIGRLILQYAGCKKPMVRLWTSRALSPVVVKEELQRLRPSGEFDRIYRSALARQQADWLIGMNGSRAIAGFGDHSIGRVQTATLALIVSQENSIMAFKPTSYWRVAAKFETLGGEAYAGMWHAHSGENASRIMSVQKAESLVTKIKGKKGQVADIKESSMSIPPPMLMSLADLQKEANAAFGYSAAEILMIAQTLYEKHEALTYPRTESCHLDDGYVDEAAKTLAMLAKTADFQFQAGLAEVNRPGKRVFDTTKLSDHYAIIPTTGGLPGGASQRERNVYNLVAKRFVAAFYPNYRYNTVTAITEVDGERFLTSGRAIVDKGWRAVLGADGSVPPVPPIAEGDEVLVAEVDKESAATTPPPRYSEGVMIKDVMKNAAKFVTDPTLKKILKGDDELGRAAGIGTPATRAGILETLKRRGYIALKGKFLVPTDKGLGLIRAIKSWKVSDVGFTAVLEQTLNDIASGETSDTAPFMAGVMEAVGDMIRSVRAGDVKLSVDAGAETGRKIGDCPVCKSPLLETHSSFICGSHKAGGCDYHVAKYRLEGFFKKFKKTMKAADVRTLVLSMSLYVEGYTSPSKKTKFSTVTVIKKDPQYGWSPEFDFNAPRPYRNWSEKGGKPDKKVARRGGNNSLPANERKKGGSKWHSKVES